MGKTVARARALVLLSSAIVLMGSLIAPAQDSIPAVVAKAKPAVVMIVTKDASDELLKQGTGFFISADGQLVTSRHVIIGAHSAEVKTADGKTYAVTEVLAEDEEADIIKLMIEDGGRSSNGFPFLTLAPRLPVEGEQVVVIGSPLALEGTVSDGLVSAVREIPAIGHIIQITAPISPGSSGSPVLNLRGEVVGIASFLIEEGQSLNFAIPAEKIRALVPGAPRSLNEWRFGTRDVLASVEGLSQGLSRLSEEDYAGALSFFLKALEADPRNPFVWLLAGYCYGELGHYQEAMEEFKQAIRIKPDYAEAHYNLGVTYGELGRHQEAIEAFKQAIRIKPDDAEAHYNLGVTYGELGHYQEAMEAYKQAIRIKPDYADAHYNLGVTYGELGRHSEAMEAYKQAIRIKPDDAEAHNNLGVAYGRLGRHQEAIEAFKQAIKITPDYANAHNNLGIVYGELGRQHEAIGAFKQAIRIKPDNAEAHRNLGVAYTKLGSYDEAIEAYKQAIRIKPDFAEAHLSLGAAYLMVGNRGAALDEYAILKELNEELASILFDLLYP